MNFLVYSRKIKKIQKIIRKYYKMYENSRKFKNSPNSLLLFVKITKLLEFSKKITIKNNYINERSKKWVIDLLSPTNQKLYFFRTLPDVPPPLIIIDVRRPSLVGSDDDMECLPPELEKTYRVFRNVSHVFSMIFR